MPTPVLLQHHIMLYSGRRRRPLLRTDQLLLHRDKNKRGLATALICRSSVSLKFIRIVSHPNLIDADMFLLTKFKERIRHIATMPQSNKTPGVHLLHLIDFQFDLKVTHRVTRRQFWMHAAFSTTVHK